MFCTTCGTVIPEGQAICPQCGQPRASFAPTPPPQAMPAGFVPSQAIPWEIERYRGNIKALAYAWFIYGGVSLLLSIAGLSFARMFWLGGFAPHMDVQGLPPGLFPMVMHFALVAVVIRAALDFIAGWGLLQFERWGRIFAIVIAILSLFRIPLGTAIGIWTLVMLLGGRRTMLYEQL